MSRVRVVLDHPVARYLVIATFSLLAAWLCWKLGGSFAKVVSPESVAGFTFELGGAVAGFVAVLLISLRVLERLEGAARGTLRRVKVFLVPPEEFAKDMSYSCTVSIYDDETGEARDLRDLVPRREAGHLTVDIRDLTPNERFRLEVRDAANRTWRSEYHHPAAPRTEMKAV